MNELYILRHGIAARLETPLVPDDERPLTPKGEHRMRQIGRGLATLKVQVDRIVTSPLPRARRSAQIVAQELNLVEQLEISSVLGLASSPREIADWLRERTEARVMIVGHNPTLSDLIGLLVLGEAGKLAIELKKGGMAALSSGKLSGPRFQLEWLAPPALLRRIVR